MSVDKLYEVYRMANATADVMAEAEAAAKLKMIKTRRAADAAAADHDKKFDDYCAAVERSQKAFLDWNNAKAVASGNLKAGDVQ